MNVLYLFTIFFTKEFEVNRSGTKLRNCICLQFYLVTTESRLHLIRWHSVIGSPEKVSWPGPEAVREAIVAKLTFTQDFFASSGGRVPYSIGNLQAFECQIDQSVKYFSTFFNASKC